MKRCLPLATATFLTLATSVAAQTDAFNGTWKMNIAKSQLLRPVKSATLTLTIVGGEEKMRGETVMEDGTRMINEYTARYDGKEYPLMLNGKPSKDMVALKKIDGRNREFIQRRDGEDRGTIRRVLSSDGRTITTTANGSTSNGKPEKEIRIWERQ